MLDVALQLKSELHVFNAQKDVYNRDNITEIGATTQEALAEASPVYHFRYEVDVDTAILTFCHETGIDLLAIVAGNYSFFESLFHKSHTKALASSLDIPLLILHENSNA